MFALEISVSHSVENQFIPVKNKCLPSCSSPKDGPATHHDWQMLSQMQKPRVTHLGLWMERQAVSELSYGKKVAPEGVEKLKIGRSEAEEWSGDVQ